MAPLPSPDEQLDAFARAVSAVRDRDIDKADKLIADLRVDWRPEIPKQRQVEVLRRDHFSCRYCGGRTIPTPMLRAASLVWPLELPFNVNWRTDATHPIYVAYSASIDHVQPHAHGGSSDEIENLVTACWPCNIQKGEFSLDRLGWSLLPPPEREWDGLVSSYPALWELARPNASVNDVRYHRVWLAAFET
jgi:5-methylcytosine-specific restriction endonuclease McrA